MDFTTLWTSDFISGTHPLTPEARGVYITLICHFINKDRVVPDDDRYLAHLCNMSTRRYRTVKRTLLDGDFVTVRDGHLWIERSSEQWKKDLRFSKSQREKAEKKHRLERAKSLEAHISRSAPAGAPARASLPLPLKKEEGDKPPLSPYAFEGRVIRLKSDDLETWRSRFKHIPNIEAELTSYDCYLSDEPEDERKRWFHRTPAWLAKKDAEYAAKPQGGERVPAI